MIVLRGGQQVESWLPNLIFGPKPNKTIAANVAYSSDFSIFELVQI